MKILILSDIHGHSEVFDSISDDLQNSDAVIIAGDITNFGDEISVRNIISKLKSYNENILAVHGNCDTSSVVKYLEKEDISLHRNYKIQAGIAFLGVGGILPSKPPINTPQNNIELYLNFPMDSLSADLPLVIVTHQPAFDSKIDKTNSDFHCGDESLRSFIEQNNPLLAVSGHIHEARGIDNINDTLLVNPGPAMQGYYAIVEINVNKREITSIQLKP